MVSTLIFACGNCVYYAMVEKFPPTTSWVLIVPGWFLVLSCIRTWTGKSFAAIPPIYIGIPLVLAVFFFAPGMIGPPLGFWIPICCFIGTWRGIRDNKQTGLAKTLIGLVVLTVISLVAFGVHDYQ